MPCFSSKTCASLQCLVINGFHLRKLRFGKNHSFIQKAKPIQDHGIYTIFHTAMLNIFSQFQTKTAEKTKPVSAA